MQFGIRDYRYKFPDGRETMIVAIVLDGVEVLKIPGTMVAPLRAFLQRLEALHPTMTGTDATAKDVEPRECLHAVVDPSKIGEN